HRDAPRTDGARPERSGTAAAAAAGEGQGQEGRQAVRGRGGLVRSGVKNVLTATLVFAGAAVMLAQTPGISPRPVRRVEPTATRAAATPPAADAAKYRAWVNQYCVGCHNNKTASPANEPVNLEAASLDDLLPHAATWERVLRKLGVRAMPPQGLKHPTEAEYVGFTTWLSNALDRAWEGHATPGRYVVHRLNRTEYGNAVRDLLALDVDV